MTIKQIIDEFAARLTAAIEARATERLLTALGAKPTTAKRTAPAVAKNVGRPRRYHSPAAILGTRKVWTAKELLSAGGATTEDAAKSTLHYHMSKGRLARAGKGKYMVVTRPTNGAAS